MCKLCGSTIMTVSEVFATHFCCCVCIPFSKKVLTSSKTWGPVDYMGAGARDIASAYRDFMSFN